MRYGIAFLSLCIVSGGGISYMCGWSGVRMYVTSKENERVEVYNVCGYFL